MELAYLKVLCIGHSISQKPFHRLVVGTVYFTVGLSQKRQVRGKCDSEEIINFIKFVSMIIQINSIELYVLCFSNFLEI